MYTRRDLAKLAIAGPLAAAFSTRGAMAAGPKIDSKINGVMIGAQSYSFRDRDLDGCIAGMKEVGLGYVELWQGHLEPDRKDSKEFLDNPPLAKIHEARKKFDDAGILLYAVNYSFRKNFTDKQIENGFAIAHALRVNKITASGNVSDAARIDKFANKHKVYVGFHNHDSMHADEFSTPDDFAAAMKGNSKYIGINLDVGHFTAANFDPIDYIEKMHTHILTLHIKDRKKDHGDNMPFGQGDTNIKGVLELLRTKKYPIPAMIEYEFGQDGVDTTLPDMKRSFGFIKTALGMLPS